MTNRRPRAELWRGRRFVAEVFDGSDEALAALDAVQGGLVSTPFQSLNWLTLLFEELAPQQRATPRLVVVTDRSSGEVAIVLPLVIQKKRHLRIARYANLGVASLGAPLLGPAAVSKPRSIRRVWRAIRRAMPDVDLIRLERMPVQIGEQRNPLLTRRGVTPSRFAARGIEIDRFEVYADGLGNEAAEIESCRQVLAGEGRVRFYQARGPQEITRVFSALEEQQQIDRLMRLCKLNDRSQRAFYERLALDGSDAGLCCLFALEVDGLIIATLLGIRHDDMFSVLQMTTAGPAWADVSPAKLILFEALRALSARGVMRFDLGRLDSGRLNSGRLGDDGFKRLLGGAELPLYDLIVAHDLAALPKAFFLRAKGHISKNAQMAGIGRRFQALFGR